MSPSIELPNQLELLSIRETWNVNYDPTAKTRPSIIIEKPYRLIIKNTKHHSHQYLTLLQHWLKRKAKFHLSKWLQALSEDTELEFRRLSIRNQKTRWGSCSSAKNVNLNYKLMFLPARLAEYVMLHELCHTKELNHSKNFWDVVAQFEPEYKEQRKLLRQAYKELPKWLHY